MEQFTYHETLRALLEQGHTQDELARLLETTQPTLSRWLSGSEPRGRSLERIRLLAISKGVVAQPDGHSHQPANRATGDIPSLLIAPGMGNGSLESVQFDDDGRINPDQLGGYWSFPDPVRALWSHMQETYAFRAIGDSMEPTIAEGSYVFVDTMHRYPSPTDIYVVDYGDGMVVKRIELIPTTEKAKVISDNARLTDYTVRREDLQVFGRVVAWFQWKG